MSGKQEGGCVCGAVRYRVKAKPQAGLVCHCTWCQRRSGSAFAFIAYFNEADVEFLQGRLTGHVSAFVEHFFYADMPMSQRSSNSNHDCPLNRR